jgi:hypothetical protein
MCVHKQVSDAKIDFEKVLDTARECLHGFFAKCNKERITEIADVCLQQARSADDVVIESWS